MSTNTILFDHAMKCIRIYRISKNQSLPVYHSVIRMGNLTVEQRLSARTRGEHMAESLVT